jgi:hypothetical protein
MVNKYSIKPAEVIKCGKITFVDLESSMPGLNKLGRLIY